MSKSVNASVESLAQVLKTSQDEILHEWRLQADKLLRGLRMDRPTLIDHIPSLIAEITNDLLLHSDGEFSTVHTLNSPPAHGVQRFYDGLNVDEVVAEYNLLRVAFITVVERRNLQIAGESIRILNHRIDGAVRMAVAAFATLQATIRKKQQEEHLAFIAHDLRTPLNAISLLVTELRDGYEPKILEEMGDLFEVLTRNVRRIEELITKVVQANIDFETEGGSFRPERRTFDLWPQVQRLIHDLGSVSSKNSITVINHIPRSLIVFADAAMISLVFQNLLSNAFTYTHGGQVTLNARDDNGTITCYVTDNGEGITPEMLPKVFDKLATDPAKTGTGLGLAIVKQIVEAHGGTVHVESIHGAGATFSFTIPKQPESLS